MPSSAGKLYLPLELWIEIMLMLPKRDLPRLRVVNRTFYDIITPAVFKSISIHMNDRSINRFLDLLDNPDLVGHVQDIKFEEAARPYCEIDPHRVQLEAIFSTLHRTPALKSLSLSFYIHLSEYFNTMATYIHTHQWEIIKALVYNPNSLPALRSLSLVNFLPTGDSDSFHERMPFANIIAPLHHLRISFQNPDPKRERFVMPHILRSAANLVSLEIIGRDLYLINEKYLDLANAATCPHLVTLCLRNVVWLGDTISREGVVTAPAMDFIVRHRKTLKKLALHKCVVGISSSGMRPSIYWADVYERLAEKLTELVELDVETDAYRTPYTSLRRGAHPGYALEANNVEGKELDRDTSALKAFKLIVEKRKMDGTSIDGDVENR